MAKKVATKETVVASRLKSSSLLDTRVVYCGDNLEQLAKLPTVRAGLAMLGRNQGEAHL
jgi:hypothetical protein